MNRIISRSILAGVLVSLGCIANITVGGIVGAVLFSTGLLAVIALRAYLFTGMIGYSPEPWKLVPVLMLNYAAAIMCGLLYRACGGDCAAMLAAKLDKNALRLMCDSTLCGALVFVAVEGTKRLKSVLITVLAVTVFVAVGGEHCVADAFYVAAGGFAEPFECAKLLLITPIWNGIGALAINLMASKQNYEKE